MKKRIVTSKRLPLPRKQGEQKEALSPAEEWAEEAIKDVKKNPGRNPLRVIEENLLFRGEF